MSELSESNDELKRDCDHASLEAVLRKTGEDHALVQSVCFLVRRRRDGAGGVLYSHSGLGSARGLVVLGLGRRLVRCRVPVLRLEGVGRVAGAPGLTWAGSAKYRCGPPSYLKSSIRIGGFL